MNLEENEHILENKELKTNTQKRRFIAINNTSESSFTNGLVTIIHQEQFNQLKEEFKQLEENVENPITEDDLQSLENQIEGLQKENQELKTINEEISEELKDKSIKLELALNNKQFEEASSSKDKTISILEEDKKKLEGKVEAYEHEVTVLDEEIKKLKEDNQSAIDELKEEKSKIIEDSSEEIHSLKLALAKTITEYEHLKNRSFFQRLRNKNTVELSNYNKLIEKKPVYTIETKLDE